MCSGPKHVSRAAPTLHQDQHLYQSHVVVVVQSPANLLHLCLPPTSSLLTQAQEEDLDVAGVVGRVHRDVGVAVVAEDNWVGVPERLLHLWALCNPPQDFSGQFPAVGDTLNKTRLD